VFVFHSGFSAHDVIYSSNLVLGAKTLAIRRFTVRNAPSMLAAETVSTLFQFDLSLRAKTVI